MLNQLSVVTMNVTDEKSVCFFFHLHFLPPTATAAAAAPAAAASFQSKLSEQKRIDSRRKSL